MSTQSYYPSQRYADKKLAPEKMDTSSVTSLAKAAKIARDQGLLRNDVIDLLLPNMMVEGRVGDYGVNRVELPNSKQATGIIKALGIDNSFVKGITGRLEAIPQMEYSEVSGLNGKAAAGYQDHNAKLVIAAMSQKQSTASAKHGPEVTADRIIQLWNGTGPLSERHRARVLEADQMLKTDPTNKGIKDLWDNIMGALPAGPMTTEDVHTQSAVLDSMINNYDSSK